LLDTAPGAPASGPAPLIHDAVYVERKKIVGFGRSAHTYRRMQSTDDSALLRRYLEDHSDAAFATLETRHINLVYSVALRHVGDPHQAEEITQAVFILLARKAAQLRHHKALSSWLFQATRLTASNFVRGETRRHRREQEAHVQAVLDESGSDVWRQIAPLLDTAVASLSEKDRQAIVLRFYEGRNLRDVGAALGASEDAAEKRVSRAVERLREFFAKRGVTVGANGLVVVIAANAVQAAPVGLAVAISTAAALVGTTVATTATATATQAIAMTATQKLLIATIIVTSVITPVLVQHRAQTKLAEQDSALRRQADRLAELQKENKHLAKLIADSNSSTTLPSGQFNELLRLRGQVGRLNRDVQELTQLQAASSTTGSNVLATAEKVWSERANQLKQWLETNPAGKIPELQFLTDQGWIESIYPFTLSNDEEYLRAMSLVRANAENHVLDILFGALHQYGQERNGQFPSNLSQLSPYFRSPIDDAILDRYEIVRADSLVSELQCGEDWVITQKAPVDEVRDLRATIGLTRGASADSRVTNRWVKTH
jgi:RNA polymerase sigma factor (sigma-70 family)